MPVAPGSQIRPAVENERASSSVTVPAEGRRRDSCSYAGAGLVAVPRSTGEGRGPRANPLESWPLTLTLSAAPTVSQHLEQEEEAEGVPFVTVRLASLGFRARA